MPSERRIPLRDRLPSCPVRPAPPGGTLGRVSSWSGRLVLDHGCGDAHRRGDLERAGATYVGLDPFSLASDLRCAGERIPLRDACVDAVISHAVLHLVPHPLADLAEIGRVLKPGGWLVGYVGYLEGDTEQVRFPFSHLALSESLAEAGMELTEISVEAYGIDLQLGNLLVPFGLLPRVQRGARSLLRSGLGAWMGISSAAFGWRQARREGIPWAEGRRLWRTWLDVGHASGFQFTARRRGGGDPTSGPAPLPWQPLLRSPIDGLPLTRLARGSVPGMPADAEPEAAEWMVAEGSSMAFPVVGRQLLLSRDRAVALR